MDRPQLPGVLLVVFLLLSGCAGVSPPEQGGQADTTLATESQSDREVVVKGGGLPVDANRTFRRVERLLGTNGTPPTVRVSRVDARPPRDHRRPGKFSELLQVNETFPALDDVAGGAREDSVLIRYTDRASPGRIERTLAHEFAHVLQPDSLDSTIRSDVRGEYRRTTDAEFARISVVEGVAVYVADRYAKRYLDDTRTYAAEFRANWTNLSAGVRSYRAPYYYGQQYVGSRMESGADLEAIYANPPRTAEQVLHNRTPDEEPRRQLAVNATTPGSAWDLTDEDTKGELCVRHLLEGELATDRAKRAAAGWGNDRVFTYYDVTKAGHVWVTRWDDTGEASEFEAALADFLDRRYERNGTHWSGEGAAFRIDRARSDTVALVAGHPSFPNATSVAANESGVNVETAE